MRGASASLYHVHRGRFYITPDGRRWWECSCGAQGYRMRKTLEKTIELFKRHAEHQHMNYIATEQCIAEDW